jgi:hypothetical protein
MHNPVFLRLDTLHSKQEMLHFQEEMEHFHEEMRHFLLGIRVTGARLTPTASHLPLTEKLTLPAFRRTLGAWQSIVSTIGTDPFTAVAQLFSLGIITSHN